MAKAFHKGDRRSLLAKIHIAKKDLGLSDEDYRAILDERYGCSSAGQLGVTELIQLVHHFENLGWQKERRTGWMQVPHNVLHRQQKLYIAALWSALGYTMPGLDKRCKKQFGVDRFIWLQDKDHLQTLAKDLNNRCRKRGIDPDPEGAY